VTAVYRLARGWPVKRPFCKNKDHHTSHPSDPCLSARCLPVEEGIHGILECRYQHVRRGGSVELQDDIDEHTRIYQAGRIVFDNATYDAEHRPELVTMINIDAPTRRQFDLPRLPRARDLPKRLEGSYMKRWESKVTGAMDAGVGMRVYMAHEAVGGGPNLVATVLYLTIVAHQEHGRPLGRVLVVELDNTCAENKCIIVIGVCGWFVAVGTFDQVLINCMMVGHTFTLLDQSFNTMINSMGATPLPTVESMLSAIFRGMREYSICEVTELSAVFDFSAWLAPTLNDLKGFAQRRAMGGLYTGMGQFCLTRDASGARQAYLKMRATALAGTWIPEGNGYPVFKDCGPPSADSSPPYAKLKPFAVWQMDRVVATIRQWIPFLGIDPATQRSCQDQWERRLTALHEDVTSVSTNLPKWAGEVVRMAVATTRNVHAQGARPWIGIVENPPINPIVGPDRTDADYRREIQNWQDASRAEANTLGLPPPIHLGDYLIVVNGNRPTLVSVQGGALGVLWQDVNVTVTLYDEYESQPPGWGWGAFQPQKNPAYDKNDRSKGAMYSQLHDLRRTQVLVYHCKTFLDADRKLRIHLDSLCCLAACERAAFELPPQIPNSHKRCPQGAPAAYVRPMDGRADTGAAAAATGRGEATAGDTPLPEDQYRIKKLLARKRSRGARLDGCRKNTWMYLVLWEDYDVSEASWEPARNVADSAIREFEAEHGSAHSSDCDEEGSDDGGADQRITNPLPEAMAEERARLKELHKVIFGESDTDSDA
jgi:hypothetical protein